MKKPLFILLTFAGIWACNPGSYHLTQRTANRIGVDSLTAKPDSSVANFLMPYRQQMNQTMNQVLATSTGPIEKGTPDAPLNDLLTDALLQQSIQKFGKQIDCSHLNFGGIRNNLPGGNITVGSIFEVMPFDNRLVVLTLNGTTLQQLLNHFANKQGLVVGGLRAKIHDKQVHDVTFTNGRTLQPAEIYTVVMSDYVANGGDDAGFLKNVIKQEDINYLMRDALIDYFRQRGQTGQPITPTSDGRISTD